MTMFVGKFLGIPILGFYNRADVFSIMIFKHVIGVVWKVGYPVYSQLQLDTDRFKQAYLKTLQLLTFIGIPMAGGLFVLSQDFVYLFLTDKWLPIVPLMQILCLQAVLSFINTPAGIAFQASGRPSIGTKISALGVMILVTLVYPLSVRWGAPGAAASLFLSVLLTSPIVWYMAIRVMRCTYSEFFKPVLISLINTGIMVSVVLAMKDLIGTQIGFGGFFGLVFMGVFIYGGMSFIIDKYTNYKIYG